jgi:hypothetical protein
MDKRTYHTQYLLVSATNNWSFPCRSGEKSTTDVKSLFTWGDFCKKNSMTSPVKVQTPPEFQVWWGLDQTWTWLTLALLSQHTVQSSSCSLSDETASSVTLQIYLQFNTFFISQTTCHYEKEEVTFWWQFNALAQMADKYYKQHLGFKLLAVCLSQLPPLLQLLFIHLCI